MTTLSGWICCKGRGRVSSSCMDAECRQKKKHISLLQRLHKCLRDCKKGSHKQDIEIKPQTDRGRIFCGAQRRGEVVKVSQIIWSFWMTQFMQMFALFQRKREWEWRTVYSQFFSLLNIYHCSEDKCYSFSITRLINGIMDRMLDVVFKHVSYCNSTVFG